MKSPFNDLERCFSFSAFFFGVWALWFKKKENLGYFSFICGKGKKAFSLGF